MAIFLQNVDLLGIRRLMVFAKDTSTQRAFFPFCRLKGRRLKGNWTVREEPESLLEQVKSFNSDQTTFKDN